MVQCRGMEQILTPLNHREIEYNAKKLSGCDIPDSFLYKSDQARALQIGRAHV